MNFVMKVLTSLSPFLYARSLSTLSRVMTRLGEQDQQHIPFRDSILTRILTPSLSGNSRVAFVCCAIASEEYAEETRSTLVFASSAKLVKTRAKVNEVLTLEPHEKLEYLGSDASSFVDERSQLKAQVAIATSQVKTLSSEVEAKKEAVASMKQSLQEMYAELVETRGKLESLCTEKQSLSEDLKVRRANEIALTDQLQNAQDALGAAYKEIDSLKASFIEMEPQRAELNAALATTSAQASKAKVDPKPAIEEARKEDLRNAQASPEANREEIDSLRTNISEVEGTHTELVKESEASFEGSEYIGSAETCNEDAARMIQDPKSQDEDDGSVNSSVSIPESACATMIQ